MVAATALGDVVEQRGDDENFGTREVGDEARTQRVFVRVLRLHEPPQVAYHHQDVLVDGVDVKKVVLHLSDDATENREIASQNAVLVHATQLVRDAARLAQDLDEARAVDRIAPERCIDPVAIAPERAQQRRRHPLELGVLLECKKALEDRRRSLHEQRFVLEIEQLVDDLEIGVEIADLDLRGKQPAVQVLQQDHVDLTDRFGGAIVALHQLLGRAPDGRVGEAHLARERSLHVEDQAILAAARHVVQANAQLVDQPLVTCDLARFMHRHQLVSRQFAPRVAEPCSPRDPQDGLEVAQPAGAFLEVRLEVVRRVLIAQMTLLLLERLRLVEAAHIERGGKATAKARVQRGASLRAGDARAGSCAA